MCRRGCGGNRCGSPRPTRQRPRGHGDTATSADGSSPAGPPRRPLRGRPGAPRPTRTAHRATRTGGTTEPNCAKHTFCECSLRELCKMYVLRRSPAKRTVRRKDTAGPAGGHRKPRREREPEAPPPPPERTPTPTPKAPAKGERGRGRSAERRKPPGTTKQGTAGTARLAAPLS